MLKITYIAHSSFFVETTHTCLLFDYYTGTIPKVPEGKKLYVFASHRHSDHYSKKIFELKDIYPDVRYLLSDDIEKVEGETISYLKDDIVWFDSLIEVSTYKSNDEGIAFLVDVDGYTIYHAGDLNNWDWIGEDPKWLESQKNLYHTQLNKLKDTHIDVAFVPVDSRLEENYYKGALDLVEACHPSYIVPMHCWNKYDIIHKLIEDYIDKDQVLSFVEPGETMHVEI